MFVIPRTIRIKTSFFLLLFFLAGNAMAQDKHIDTTVNGNKLVFLNSECPGRPGEMGCVLAEYANAPVISWELTGMGADPWSFTALQFSPDGVHWGEGGYPLSDCTVEDFDLTEADRNSGYASSAQVVAGGKRLHIRDRNRNECVTHYRLYAESIDGGRIDSDPIIDNRGGGR